MMSKLVMIVIERKCYLIKINAGIDVYDDTHIFIVDKCTDSMAFKYKFMCRRIRLNFYDITALLFSSIHVKIVDMYLVLKI